MALLINWTNNAEWLLQKMELNNHKNNVKRDGLNWPQYRRKKNSTINNQMQEYFHKKLQYI